MPGPSISLDGVSLKYGDNLILQGIQTQFEAGQCHVIMGPNGGGKTSLLRSVLGLTPFTGISRYIGQIQSRRNKQDKLVMCLKRLCLKPVCH